MTKADDIIRLAMRNGFDEAVAHTARRRRSYLKITNSQIDSIVEKFDEYGMLFASSDKRVFFTGIENLGSKSIENRVGKAKSLIGMVEKKEDYYGIAEGPFKYRKRQGYDKKIENYTNDTIADIAYACINKALENGAESVAGLVYVSSADVKLATSKKVSVSGKNTAVRISLRVFAKNLGMQNITSARYLKDIKPEKFAEETAHIISQVKKTGKIGTGRYDAVYTQSSAGSLMTYVNGMAAMGSVEDGTCFTKKLGKEVANKSISVYDDGNMDGAINASPYDDEGYPTQRTEVIKDGILKNYLHNFSTAMKYKTKSTGNAGLVSPEPNTMVFEHKKRVRSIDELIRKVDRGLLITNTGYTRFANYLTGDFSTVPKDLIMYIEKGEPKFAVQQKNIASMVGIRITENMIRMLNNTECAANDTKQETSWDAEGSYCFMPSILVRDVAVTAA